MFSMLWLKGLLTEKNIELSRSKLSADDGSVRHREGVLQLLTGGTSAREQAGQAVGRPCQKENTRSEAERDDLLVKQKVVFAANAILPKLTPKTNCVLTCVSPRASVDPVGMSNVRVY